MTVKKIQITKNLRLGRFFVCLSPRSKPELRDWDRPADQGIKAAVCPGWVKNEVGRRGGGCGTPRVGSLVGY